MSRLTLILSLATWLTLSHADYWDDREKFIQRDAGLAIGASLELNNDELEVNKILMGYKLQEYGDGFTNPGNFSPARHFFHARKDIETSPVFEMIRKLPKGASLHSHDTAMVSGEFLYNLTYRDNLYVCKVDDRARLKFFKVPDTSCNWSLVSELRRRDDTFDEWLQAQITLVVPDPKTAYPDINVVWGIFSEIFATVTPMITYRPTFVEHFYQTLQEFYDDNVKYIEFRGTLPPVYELNGKEYTPAEVVGIYKHTVSRFKNDHPDFIGAKFIYGPYRGVGNGTITDYAGIMRDIKEAHPNFIAGFDLVGQEDLGRPLKEFVGELEMIGKDVATFYHAGETNWNGASTDMNLIDAVLLGTRRIGHGFAIVKHPEVFKAVKERGIAIEVAPISNQVLMLVDDIRNHPANIMIAHGLPVVICNDDPTYWGARGLSYDWYMAFMGMTSREADLKFLKQLAINSYLYSAMTNGEKTAALDLWERDWRKFIKQYLSYSSNNIFRK